MADTEGRAIATGLLASNGWDEQAIIAGLEEFERTGGNAVAAQTAMRAKQDEVEGKAAERAVGSRQSQIWLPEGIR